MTRRCKIMLLGEIGVGKTSLVRRLVHDTFDGSYSSTFGFDLHTYLADTEAGPLEMILWDTDGSVGSGLVRSDLYMAGTAGAMIVCDLMRVDTHAAASRLASEFVERQPGRDVALVVNKADLSPAPSVPQILSGTGHPVVLSSAKTGHQVRAAFHGLAQSILRRGL